MKTIKLYGNCLGNDINNPKGGNKFWHINPKYITSITKMTTHPEYTPCAAVNVMGISRSLYIRESEEEILNMLDK